MRISSETKSKKKKFKLLASGFTSLALIALVFTFSIAVKSDSSAAGNESAVYKNEKLSELNAVNEELEVYDNSSNVTSDSWHEEGKLLQKKAELEKQTDSESYYKNQLDMLLDATDAGVHDMQSQLNNSNSYGLTGNKKKELAERIEKFGAFSKSVKESIKNHNSYEELFNKSQKESERLSDYFFTKYTQTAENAD